jgi:predicted alpha/beta-fold hydrolase
MHAQLRAGRLLGNPHVQTLAAALPLHAPPRGFAPDGREDLLVPLPGDAGALLARAWWQPRERGPRPTAVLLHGVGGTSESYYLVRAAVAYYEAGFHAVRLNMRGVGAGVPYSASVYHAGLSGDVDAAVTTLAADRRVASVHLTGCSIGGHLLLHLGAAWSASAPSAVRSVVAISPPLSLAVCSHHLERRRLGPYRWHVVAGLRRTALAHLALRPGSLAGVTQEELRRMRTIRDYDERIVAPLHGFRSAVEYYERASVAEGIERIHVPTLFLYAEDDPMVPPAAVVPYLARAGPGIRPETTPTGGHVGFVERPTRRGLTRTWAIERALSFAAEHDLLVMQERSASL